MTHDSRPPRPARATALSLIWMMAACGGEPAEPDASVEPTAVRASTPIQVDTIEALPATMYSVEVRDESGGISIGREVVFSGENMSVAAGTSPFGATVSASTDANGRAAVRVRFGTMPGDGRIVANVPTLSVADTLPFVIEAGAPQTVAMALGDTTVTIGTVLAMGVAAEDRLGNPVEAQAQVVVGAAVLDGDDATFPSLGVSTIRVEAGGNVASATVLAIPDGTLVYTSGTQVWLVDFDGTDREMLPFTVPSVREPSIDWSDDGQRLVVGGYDGYRVFDLQTDEVYPAAWPGGDAGGEVIWPRFKPDGTIFYSQNDGGGWDLRTADIDATSPRTIIPADRFPEEDLNPDWAPDGSVLSFTADWEENNKFLLRIADTLAASVATLQVEAATPVWSPDMSMLGYQELGIVGVVSPDGVTITREWVPGWSKGVSWDPDSSMLVGINGGTIEVIDVATGVVMAFPQLSTSANAVGWRPRIPPMAP